MKTIVVEDRAKEEIKNAFFWYLEKKEQTALRFYQSLTNVLDILVVSPKIGRLLDDRHRKFHLTRFPYNIIYREDAEIIYVIAVAHHSRKPGYWLEEN